MSDIAPDVSIIIPTFNRMEMLERAIRSALNQEGVMVEVIVVDDGSTDNTANLLDTLTNSFGSRLRVIRQSNAGAAAARNTGLDAARGKYVQFLDSDDSLSPQKVHRQVTHYKTDPAATVVLCYGWMETPVQDERIGADLGTNPQPYLEKMCGRSVHVVQTSAPLWRRVYLCSEDRRWDETISLGDDLEFHLRCLADAERVAFVSEPLFTVQHHDGDRLSDFSSDDGRLSSLLKTRETIHAGLLERGCWTEGCRRNMAEAIRSMYALYLMRMPQNNIAHFEAVATNMCGPAWRENVLGMMAVVRRAGGTIAARRYFDLAKKSRLTVRRFAWSTWIIRGRKLAKSLSSRPREEVTASRQATRKLAEEHPKRDSALYIELNAFHAEIIPGYSALLAQAGYEVTVLHRITSGAEEAIARLPEALQPRLVGLTLKDMKRIATGEVPKHYDLVVLGSGTLAEPYGYCGSALDFLGCIPEGRNGHLIIEHALRTLLTRNERLQSDNLFGLRTMRAGSRILPMLAPVEFGSPTPAALSAPIKMAVVGRLNPDMRDMDGLFNAVRALMRSDGPAFEIQLIGGADLDAVPQDIRPVFRALGRLSFREMYNAIDQTHFLLPLLNSNNPAHRGYLHRNTSGTRQLSLGFHTPMVMDASFAKAYSFDSETAVLYTPDDLKTGLDQARRMSHDDLLTMQKALSCFKNTITKQSLSNLRVFLNGVLTAE